MANTCNTEICKTLIAMMSTGCTQEEVCAQVGVTPKTFIEWRRKGGQWYEKEFAEAYEVAKVLQRSWWMKRGRDNIGEGRDFNTPLFSLYMANLFGWRGGHGKDDEAMAEIRQIKENLGIEDS